MGSLRTGIWPRRYLCRDERLTCAQFVTFWLRRGKRKKKNINIKRIFTKSWDIAEMSVQTNDDSVRTNRGLLPSPSRHIGSGNTGTWHATLHAQRVRENLEKENPKWRRPLGRPQSSGIDQLDERVTSDGKGECIETYLWVQRDGVQVSLRRQRSIRSDPFGSHINHFQRPQRRVIEFSWVFSRSWCRSVVKHSIDSSSYPRK